MPRIPHGAGVSVADIRAAAEGVAERSAGVAFAFAAVTPADPSRFDYLFPDLQNDPDALLPVSAQTVVHLKNLGRAMRDRSSEDETNSTVPRSTPISDSSSITTSRSRPCRPRFPVSTIRVSFPCRVEMIKTQLMNIRTATLDLDSLYGVPAPRNGRMMGIGRYTAPNGTAPPTLRPVGKTDDTMCRATRQTPIRDSIARP